MSIENDTQPTHDAQANAGGEAVQQESEVNGVQKRINELVANIHKKDEVINQLIATQQQMLAERMAQQQGQPQREEDPYAGILPDGADEATKQMFAKMGSFFAQQLDAKLKGIQTQLAMSTVGSEVNQLAQKYNVSDAVARRTQELLAGWRQKGLPFNTEDALRFAAGEVALQAPPDPRASQQVPVFRAANPVPQVRAPAEQPLPQNFDDMSIEDQWLVLAKRVGDKAL